MSKSRMLLLAVSFSLAACTTAPKTVSESLVVANATLEASNDSIVQLYCPDPPKCELGVITREQAVSLYQASKRASDLLDLTTAALRTGDTAAASDYLGRANAAILILRRQITEQKGVQNAR